jgi:hypothetical protein
MSGTNSAVWSATFRKQGKRINRGRPSRSETPPEQRLVIERHPVAPGAPGGDRRAGGSGPHDENACCPKAHAAATLRWPDPGLRRPTADFEGPGNTTGGRLAEAARRSGCAGAGEIKEPPMVSRSSIASSLRSPKNWAGEPLHSQQLSEILNFTVYSCEAAGSNSQGTIRPPR